MKQTDYSMLFIKIVEAGSLKKAADEMAISAPQVSRYLKRLEKELGVALIQRTTRSLSLTEEGKVYYESCQRIEEEKRLTQLQLQNLKAEPVGKLKISLTRAFCQAHMMDLIFSFSEKYPEIRFDLDTSDQQIDIIESGFDLAIRIGELKDSRLKHRPITRSELLPVASQKYIKKHGRPNKVEQLVDHHFIATNHLPSIEKRQLSSLSEHAIQIQQRRLVVNDVISVKQAVLGGMGISFLPTYLIQKELDEAQLFELLPDLPRIEHDIYAVFPNAPFMPHKTRLFLEHLVNYFL